MASSQQPLSNPIDLTEYLLLRLRELGLRSVHGVPGDYNLTALDYVEPCGLTWVGNCNELNSGYAADGYARIKGIGALFTAFGVGELSALNAVAGSYAEMAPLVHIVGTPPTTAQNAGAVLHHSLGDGNFRVFADMYAKVTVAQANLIDASTAAEMIDAVLRECWLQSRPVYIELPTNMVKAHVEGKRLETPLVLSNPAIDEGFEDMEVDTILDRIYDAERAVIIVDGFAARYRVLQELRAFVDRTRLPTFTTSFGKSLIDEHLPNFGGIYTGGATPDKGVKDFVEGADLVLRMGPLDSDVNTTGFSLGFKKEECIDFFAHNVNIGQEVFKMQHIKSLLEKLTERIDVSRIMLGYMPKRASTLSKVKTMSETDEITHDNMWAVLSAKYVKETDIVIAETGTAAQGVWAMELPSNTQLVNSSIWLSIGYAVGATQGVALAARDMGRKSRTILFEGDGSFQMTAQEVSTMVKHDLDITIFLLNNNGYTIERYIHGMEAKYNDIQPWRYTLAPEFFGAKAGKTKTFTVSNIGELTSLIEDPDFQTGKGLQFVEVKMPWDSAPEPLKIIVDGAKKRNQGEN